MMQQSNPPTYPTVIASVPASGKKHKVIPGTVWLSNQVTKMGSRKFLGTLFLIVAGVVIVGTLIVVYLGPLLTLWWHGLGGYQANTYVYYGRAGAPGEVDAQHYTTLSFVYTNHLIVVEVPAGNNDRTMVTHAPSQIMKHPRIGGFKWGAATAGNAPNLEITVESDDLMLNSPKYVFTFSNHVKEMSADPKSPGYHVAQFQFLSVVEV